MAVRRVARHALRDLDLRIPLQCAGLGVRVRHRQRFTRDTRRGRTICDDRIQGSGSAHVGVILGYHDLGVLWRRVIGHPRDGTFALCDGIVVSARFAVSDFPKRRAHAARNRRIAACGRRRRIWKYIGIVVATSVLRQREGIGRRLILRVHVVRRATTGKRHFLRHAQYGSAGRFRVIHKYDVIQAVSQRSRKIIRLDRIAICRVALNQGSHFRWRRHHLIIGVGRQSIIIVLGRIFIGNSGFDDIPRRIIDDARVVTWNFIEQEVVVACIFFIRERHDREHDQRAVVRYGLLFAPHAGGRVQLPHGKGEFIRICGDRRSIHAHDRHILLRTMLRLSTAVMATMVVEMPFAFACNCGALPADEPAGTVLHSSGGGIGSQNQASGIFNSNRCCVVKVEYNVLQDQGIQLFVELIVAVVGSLLVGFHRGDYVPLRVHDLHRELLHAYGTLRDVEHHVLLGQFLDRGVLRKHTHIRAIDIDRLIVREFRQVDQGRARLGPDHALRGALVLEAVGGIFSSGHQARDITVYFIRRLFNDRNIPRTVIHYRAYSLTFGRVEIDIDLRPGELDDIGRGRIERNVHVAAAVHRDFCGRGIIDREVGLGVRSRTVVCFGNDAELRGIAYQAPGRLGAVQVQRRERDGIRNVVHLVFRIQVFGRRPGSPVETLCCAVHHVERSEFAAVQSAVSVHDVVVRQRLGASGLDDRNGDASPIC